MSCCPSFLLAGAGSHLSICGVVQTDKLIVQHLADVHLRVDSTYGDKHLYHIAKLFFSLRRARETLAGYYQGIEVPTALADLSPSLPVEELAIPGFFPYLTEFKQHPATTPAESMEPEVTESTELTEPEAMEPTNPEAMGPTEATTRFRYINVPSADPANVTFFAEVVEPEPRRKLVVKFVDRYGVEAHETLAEKGMAPRLLYYGTLDGQTDLRAGPYESTLEHGLYIGPLRMVVMEHIESEDWPDDAREQVKSAINLLHAEGLVFGDLRPPNVLFSQGKIFLIDFDWAGKFGEVRYPRGLSEKVTWAGKPEELERQLITFEHDITMLDHLFSSTQD